MKIVQCVIGVVLGMFIMASHAQAQRAAHTMIGQIQPDIVATLGLSPEQNEKLDTLKVKFSQELMIISNALKVKRLALNAGLQTMYVDKKKVDALVAEIGQLSQQEMAKQVEQVFAIREVLTPEQNQKLIAAQVAKKDQGGKGAKGAKGGKHKGKKKADQQTQDEQ